MNMSIDFWSLLPDFGRWLREMSLAGGWNNVLAWGVVLALTALPALGLLRKGRSKWDLLLLLAAGEVFAGLYFLVNPTMLATPISIVGNQTLQHWWGVAAVCTIISTLLAWVVLRWLERADGITEPGRMLACMLKWSGWGLRVWVVWSVVLKFVGWDVLGSVDTNGGGGAELIPTFLIMLLVWGADMVPDLMFCGMLVQSGDFVRKLEAAPFGEETLTAAEELRTSSERVLGATVLLGFGRNLLQMLAMPVIYNMHLDASIPVGSILLAAALGLLCRYFRRAKAVSDDNDSII